MLPTKFWAEMTWPDFQRADMSKVIAVLPVAAIEQHGPHLPVGVDAFINEGYVKRAAARVPEDLSVLFLPLQTIGVSGEHADFPGTLTLSTETRDSRLDGDRRQRRARWLPEAHRDEFARRQRPCDRRRRALAAHALAHAGDQRLLAAARLSRRPVLFPRGGARCSRRRCRDIADAGLAAGDRAHAAKRAISRASAKSMEREFALLRAKPPLGFAWMASDLNPEGRSRRGQQGERRKGRGCGSIMALSDSSRCFATWTLSISRASPLARWEPRDDRAAFRFRARGDGAGLPLGCGRRRGRARSTRRPCRRRGGHSRSGRSARGARRFEGAERGQARRTARRSSSPKRSASRSSSPARRRSTRTTSAARRCGPWRAQSGL